MGDEAEAAAQSTEESVRSMMFAHAFVSENPKLFQTMFPDFFGPQGLTAEEEDSLEWEVPQNAAEAQGLLGELAELGLPLDVAPPLGPPDLAFGRR